MEDKIPTSLSKKRILVIDDQGAIRVVFSTFLKDIGFQYVDCAMDGQDGLKLMGIYPYDLIICDWEMPKLSGLELLVMLRDSEQAKKMPFIMATSTSDTDDVKQAIDAGVTDYIIKPFQPLQLKQKVISHLSKSDYKAQKINLKQEQSDNEKEFDLDKSEQEVEAQANKAS